MAEAELCLLASLRGSVKDFFEAHLHVGTAFATVNVAMLEGAEMSPGQSQFVQLRLPEPIPLCPGDRFVLRANLAAQGQTGLVTAGGGRILGVSDTRLRRRKQWTIDLLRSRRDCVGEPARWCEQMLREHARPLSSAELAGFCLLRPEDLPGVLRNVRDGGSLHELPGGCFTHATVVSAAQDKMMAALEAFHAGQPQRNGMERAGLLAGSGGDSRIAEFALEGLLQARKVQQAGTVYARSGWSPRLSDQDEQLLAGTAAAVQKAGCAAPSLTDLASSLGHPSTRIQKALQILAERGTLVKIDSDMFLHRDAFLAAQQVALGLFAKKPVFTTMEFRDALNVSRKYAVPILDHFDRIRFTVRSGHDRTPGVEAKKLMTGK
jgi:selenocysteine-specific elongation factor